MKSRAHYCKLAALSPFVCMEAEWHTCVGIWELSARGLFCSHLHTARAPDGHYHTGAIERGLKIVPCSIMLIRLDFEKIKVIIIMGE
jgi:hypothetical protein